MTSTAAEPDALRPSIYDVAREAGVSHMTVSRVLNDSPQLRDETRRRILDVIEAIGYHRSEAARALSSRRSRAIGVVVDSAERDASRAALVAVQQAARGRHHSVVPFSITTNGQAGIDDAVAHLAAHRVDALCLIAPRIPTLQAITASHHDLPTVIVADTGDGCPLPSVAVDHSVGAALAARHFMDAGHHSMLHLAGPEDSVDAVSLTRSWRSVMRQSHLPAPLVVGDWSSDFGYEIGATHPGMDSVTAVFAANDRMALGLIHGLWTRGIRVPADVSVIGYDDHAGASHYLPPLTTVRQDFDALGCEAVHALLSSGEGPLEGARRRLLPRLVVRDSVAAPHPRRAPERSTSHRLAAM
ncbi:LacI family DNA-binding transcriptional regulator [Microbacterium sp. B2969]|uniref:LacI family DNA-binding transcriptional regulator n=1 Tax=Microbacterium alkaliflavum TaxID=3248839 RepID=A0ABW7QEG9_9MICO